MESILEVFLLLHAILIIKNVVAALKRLKEI
jgi:hypothetical protein